MRMRRIILLFGMLNALLYSALLPLWEGFDEAFHYAYVETLWQTSTLPVLGKTLVPLGVAKSFPLAPVSYIVHRWIPESTSFDAWFRLPKDEKQRRRSDLEALRPEPGDSTRPNYEAHHPPLAYMLLAPVDRMLSSAPITVRVLVVRWLGAMISTLLLYLGMTRLCRTLDVPEPFANAALFTMFCSQMLYATIAHVSNDWLAVGIGAMFLATLAEMVRKPVSLSACKASLWLVAGLLTKAYFLAFIPVALVAARRFRTALAMILIASPWYVRNLILYGNLSGTHEQFNGIGIMRALAAAPRIDWIATAGFLARGSLWTGNNSFTNFSRSTLNIVLALLVIALAVLVIHRRQIRPAEKVLAAATLLFSVAVAYATCASFADTKGDVAGASPWYTQVLLAPVLSLAYLGMSRWRTYGRILAALTAISWAWVLIATWTLKLFPMYSGSGAVPMHGREVWNWYVHGGAAAHSGDLSLLALAPASWLYSGLVVSLLAVIALNAILLRRFIAPVKHLPDRTGAVV